MAAVVAMCIAVAAVAACFLLQKPPFTISVSPSTVTIPRGESENLTISYDPKVPSNLSMSTGISGPGTGVQSGGWISPPFTFSVVASENAALGTYTVTLEVTDMDTGANATITFTVIVAGSEQVVFTSDV